MIDLPLKFPSQVEVITDEVARFRALTPARRMESIRSLLAAGEFMVRISPKAEFLREHTSEQENRSRRAVRDFLSRHAE